MYINNNLHFYRDLRLAQSSTDFCCYFFALVMRPSTALISDVGVAAPLQTNQMSRKVDGIWGTECLSTRFLLPKLLYAG